MSRVNGHFESGNEEEGSASPYIRARLEQQERADAALTARIRLRQQHSLQNQSISSSFYASTIQTEEKLMEELQEQDCNDEQSKSTMEEGRQETDLLSLSELSSFHQEEISILLMEDDDLISSAVDSVGSSMDVMQQSFVPNEYPTMEKFMSILGKDPSNEWNGRMIQVAKVMLEREHPKRLIPNVRDLMLTVVRDRRKQGTNQQYQVGDWVEVLSPNMIWYLEKVTKVHELKSPFNKTIYLYDVGSRSRLSAYDIRVSEEGLHRIFGIRPWIWQQWAILKLEEKLRFQNGHRDDFAVINIPIYVRSLWYEWLSDERNVEIRKLLKDKRLQSTGEFLFDHMMKPFYILEDIQKERGWRLSITKESAKKNLDTKEGFSSYTYLSLHGTGFAACIISLILQMIIPVVIVLNTVRAQNYYEEVISTGDNFEIIRTIFCVQDPNSDSKLSEQLTTFMVMCIQILYVTKVVPDSAVSFKDVSGVGGYGPDKTYARCRALCCQVLDSNKSRVSQIFGKIIDMYMNTVYVYIVFAVNLYNILNRASPTEVILNALALGFLFQIDERFGSACWWDPGKRFLKAGMMELYLQSLFESKTLMSSRLFSNFYGVDRRVVEVACDGDKSILYNYDLAEKDKRNAAFLNHSDKFNLYMNQKLENHQCDFIASFELNKPPVVFGGIEKKIIERYARWYEVLTGNEFRYGVFNRMVGYRTWSRWNKVLFLFDVPKADVHFEFNAFDESILRKIYERQKHTKQEPFRNFNPKSENKTTTGITKQQIRVLSFKQFRHRLQLSLYQGDYLRFLLWFLNGPLEWATYVIQILFPLYNLFLFMLAFTCIDLTKLALQNPEYYQAMKESTYH